MAGSERAGIAQLPEPVEPVLRPAPYRVRLAVCELPVTGGASGNRRSVTDESPSPPDSGTPSAVTPAGRVSLAASNANPAACSYFQGDRSPADVPATAETPETATPAVPKPARA